MKKNILFIIFINICIQIFPTVDFLCVNHITKQLVVFEDDDYIGIGWRSLDWKGIEKREKELISEGYKYTKFPYLIEILILLFIIAVIVFIIITFNIKKIKSGEKQ